MSKFYHNITQHVYNETEICVLLDDIKFGDTICMTTSGDALVQELSLDQLIELKTLSESEE